MPADAAALYRAAIAEAPLITAEQEDALARSIVAAERAVLEAIARCPSGADAVTSAGRAMQPGADVRSLILNPDEAGVDLDATSARVRAALLGADVESLAEVRLDLDFVEQLISAVRTAGDTAALEEIAAASPDPKRRKLAGLALGRLGEAH